VCGEQQVSAWAALCRRGDPPDAPFLMYTSPLFSTIFSTTSSSHSVLPLRSTVCDAPTRAHTHTHGSRPHHTYADVATWVSSRVSVLSACFLL